jgi:hypothetical protein
LGRVETDAARVPPAESCRRFSHSRRSNQHSESGRLVERFFRDITVNRLRRGVFTSVPELVAAIDEYIPV